MELQGTTIEIRNGSITFSPEDKTYPWWRSRLDRETDGILCPQIMQRMYQIGINLSREDENGNRISKYDIFMVNLPPNPKSSQGNMKVRYQNHLIQYLQKNENDLLRFKNKPVFVYVAIYLREERFNTYDLDNFLKAILDALKQFIGDDSKITSISTDKYKLENYPKEDMDFLEQVIIVVTDPGARSDLFK